MEPIDQELEEGELELPSQPMMLNMGPSHPAMHGTIRIVMELSGESILKADVQIGYLHRGFEKMCERGNWTQVFPYVDRCNYASPMLNNVGFALAVEKLAGISAPERCQYIRVIGGEISRVTFVPIWWHCVQALVCLMLPIHIPCVLRASGMPLPVRPVPGKSLLGGGCSSAYQ